MSNIYIAKDGERLETLFYRYYGFEDPRYRDFCAANLTLLPKDTLEAGDVVHLIVSRTEESQTTSSDTPRAKLWD